MLMEKKDLLAFIAERDEMDIYYEYLLGQQVWYFENSGNDSSKEYDRFKKFIARKLNLSFNNISIVGSAKTRFSFSPKKKFSEFHIGSDFDLILVSNSMYTRMWHAYRKVSMNKNVKGYIGICHDVFNGFISLKDDSDTYKNPDLVAWQKSINEFRAELQLSFNITHDVNYRIYSSWRSVEDYHMKGIAKLKEVINEVN